jgi:hypothetical protein
MRMIFSRKRLVHFPLVKKTLLRLECSSMQNADGAAVRPIHAKNSNAACGHPQIKKSRLHAESRRVGQQPDGKGIFKRLFNFPLSQRTIHFKGRIIPIKLHNELIVCRTPMQCNYIVFTLRHGLCQWILQFLRKNFVECGGYSFPPPLSSPLILLIMEISGRNIAITMLPTMTARKTIMMGSSNEVMADTALSTSSS